MHEPRYLAAEHGLLYLAADRQPLAEALLGDVQIRVNILQLLRQRRLRARPSRPTAASSIVESASIIEQTCSLSASLASQLIISSVLFRKCGFICDCSAL